MGKLEQRALIARHPAGVAGSRAGGEPKPNHGAWRTGCSWWSAGSRRRIHRRDGSRCQRIRHHQLSAVVPGPDTSLTSHA